eukprot:4167015-Heterocapsa_arctica.AAC.1
MKDCCEERSEGHHSEQQGHEGVDAGCDKNERVNESVSAAGGTAPPRVPTPRRLGLDTGWHSSPDRK